MASSRLWVTVAGLVLVISCMLVQPTLQSVAFTVGENLGWIPGVDYNAWAKNKHFKVGDFLVFNYPSGLSVDEVFENDYNTCNTDHPISSDNSGSTTFSLTNAGSSYFICGVAARCAQGMKLLVNVKAESTPLPSAQTSSLGTDTASSPPASNS